MLLLGDMVRQVYPEILSSYADRDPLNLKQHQRVRAGNLQGR